MNTREPTPRCTWLFAYGSLQPGAWNYEATWGDDETPPVTRAVHALGKVAFAFDGPDAYPAARFDQEGVIKGHIIRVDLLSPRWVDIYLTEWHAGYHLVEVPVYPMNWTARALAWEYDQPLGSRRLVPGGDWLAWYQA